MLRRYSPWKWGGALLLVMGLYSGCAWTRPEAARPIPPVTPGRGPALPMPAYPPATVSAVPKPYETYSFRTADGFAALFTWSPWQILLFPQLGPIFSLTDPYPYVLLFDDGKDVLMYDISAEEKLHLVDGQEVGGFAFNGYLDGKDNLYFLATSNPDLAADRLGFAYVMPADPPAVSLPSVTPGPGPRRSAALEPIRDHYQLRPYHGVPHALDKLNAFAARHHAIQSLRVTKSADLYVFTTGDGALASYEVPTDELRLLLPNKAFFEEFGGARDAKIQPVLARYIAWVDSNRGGIYMLDRWKGAVEPLPFIGTPGGHVVLSSPKFMDAYRLSFVATYPTDPPLQRLMAYDLERRVFEELVELNLARVAL